jgi:hypothetical protein
MAHTGSHRDEELIDPVAIRPRQTGTGGKTSASLCRIHFNKVVTKRRTRKGTEVDTELVLCKICTVE